MKKIKITINSDDRIIMIPMEYDSEKDSITIDQLQIEPLPDKNEDISKDIVFSITQMIMNVFSQIK
jgi:hypothetical protein